MQSGENPSNHTDHSIPRELDSLRLTTLAKDLEEVEIRDEREIQCFFFATYWTYSTTHYKLQGRLD